MSQLITKRFLLSIALGAVLMLGATACVPAKDGGTDPAAPQTTSESDASASEEPTETSDSSDVTTPRENSDADTGTNNASDDDAANTIDCDDSNFTNAATIPARIYDLGIPFYACSHEVTAVPDTEPYFLGEYSTSHELAQVKQSIVQQFGDSNWNTAASVEGVNNIFKAEIAGYSLVLVVAPSLQDETNTSIHYTLRKE